MKIVVPVLALASTLALAAPANAAGGVSAQADLNGDGRLDQVVAEPIADSPEEQSLVATVRGRRFTARVPLDPYAGVQPLRVVDLDGDGRDEVLVTESVGANTTSATAWGLFGGLRPVTGPDGSPLRLWEGGGISALSRYGCEPAGAGRRVVVVSALLTDWAVGVYDGERIAYSVAGGAATEVSRTAVTGPRDAEGFRTDPSACA